MLALDDANFVQRAKMAVEVGDCAAARHYWDEALVRYPNFAKRSRDALQILLGLESFDEAEALMVEGQRREPREGYYASGYALVAQRRGDLEEAIQRWSRVRRKFPGYWTGFVHAANCLRQTGKLNAADALLKKATERFPRQVEAWWEWAVVAEEREDWEAALRRWETVSDEFNNGYGPVGAAEALEKLGRGEEAEQRLKVAQSRYPLEPGIATALAGLAYRRGDKEAAVLCWADARRRFPKMAGGYQEGIRLLREMGQFANADQVAEAAVDRFPDDAWPIIEYALLAHGRQDWKEAALRWELVRERWPHRREGYELGAEALALLGREAEAAELRLGPPS